MKISVDTADLWEIMNRLQAIDCQFDFCPGYEKPYSNGQTCRRCQSIQQINGLLPEGERDPTVSTDEEGVCPGCGGAAGTRDNLRCDRCEAKIAAYSLPRTRCVSLLEGVSIQCYEDDDIDVLQEAVHENVADGTISPEDVLNEG